jgi:hypothetical protein
MNSSALFVIDSDPRLSGRPAEAVRIAAGIAVWKRVEVAVYLRDAAALILGEETDDLADSDNFGRYLPILEELGCPIYVRQGAAELRQLGQSATPFKEISDETLAEMAAQRAQVLRF